MLSSYEEQKNPSLPRQLSFGLKLEEGEERGNNETKPAGGTEQPGEKCSQVLTSVLKIKAKFLLTFQNCEGRKYGKLLLGSSLVSLGNSESSACKGNCLPKSLPNLHRSCLLSKQSAAAEPFHANAGTSCLEMLTENCLSPLSSSLLKEALGSFCLPPMYFDVEQDLGIAFCSFPRSFRWLSRRISCSWACCWVLELVSFRFRSDLHGWSLGFWCWHR